MLNTSRRLVNKNSLTGWYLLKTFLQDVLKTSWRCLEYIFARRLEDVLKASWKRFEDVLKTYEQDEYIGLDQDVFWRRLTKENILVLIKLSWRRLEDVFWRRRWKTSLLGRRMFTGKEPSKQLTHEFRSSPLELFLQKGVLKICRKFTGEHPCRKVISIKLQLYWNRTSPWTCKSVAYFQNTFL